MSDLSANEETSDALKELFLAIEIECKLNKYNITIPAHTLSKDDQAYLVTQKFKVEIKNREDKTIRENDRQLFISWKL